MDSEHHPYRRSTDNIEKETIVVTTEDGLVMTGSRAEAFEARIIDSIRKPLYVFGGLLFIMFIFLVGLSIFFGEINETVQNTDNMVSNATGAAAQEAQAKNIQSLLDEMNCQDQRNLQKVLDQLVATNSDDLQPVTIIEPHCRAGG